MYVSKILKTAWNATMSTRLVEQPVAGLEARYTYDMYLSAFALPIAILETSGPENM